MTAEQQSNPEAPRNDSQESERGASAVAGERMTWEQMRQHIKLLGGPDGWWHSDGEQTFLYLAQRMLTEGVMPESVCEILESAYGAVAGEFGA